MTTIGGISINVPARWTVSGYDVTLLCTQADENLFNEIRELFSLCDTTSVQWVPGRRPIPHDPTEDELNIVYIVFTHGEKPENGWYLLRSFESFEDESPLGHAWVFTASFLFIGSMAKYEPGYRMKSLEKEANDWNL